MKKSVKDEIWIAERAGLIPEFELFFTCGGQCIIHETFGSTSKLIGSFEDEKDALIFMNAKSKKFIKELQNRKKNTAYNEDGDVYHKIKGEK